MQPHMQPVYQSPPIRSHKKCHLSRWHLHCLIHGLLSHINVAVWTSQLDTASGWSLHVNAPAPAN